MFITTYSEEMAIWWTEKGRTVEPAFFADGINYWNITVEDEDKELTNPEYVSLIITETKKYPSIIGRRFAPPLHTVIVNNVIAATPDESGVLSLPLCRSIKLMRSIFTRPDKGQTPKYKSLKRHKQILNTLKRMQESGVNKVSYYVSDAVVEAFEIENVTRALEKTWKTYIM